MSKPIVGRQITITGIVQGVGFRPFIFTEARAKQITGWVRNSSAGVEIVANGENENIEDFIKSILLHPPPLARIDQIHKKEISPDGFDSFKIIKSTGASNDFMPLSPDVSICDDCLHELFDASDRRYRYPFINCTNCGPRFTIIKDIPYDRPFTTMATFQMCSACQNEYDDPSNRRFHAQPIACHECGPKIWFQTRDNDIFEAEEGLQKAREFIRNGNIVAVKGLGGFHLVCNAFDEKALQTLRLRKRRTDKPFALMASSVDVIQKYCHLSLFESDLLDSRERPIVILDRRDKSALSNLIAPNNNTVGIMLPYTPLHHLLIEQAPDFPELLVMTSGNMSDEPIAYTNDSAISDLEEIADAFLLHNRDIQTRVDDSVTTIIDSKPYMIRRARGYAPNSIHINRDLEQTLAVGGELKNTFCLTKQKYAFISHHIGDLENDETFQAFSEGISHFENIFRINPALIACDLHPDYMSTKYAQRRSLEENISLIQIQHHHAHLASCLAENSWDYKKPVIGVCFDGTGYGLDGQIWGGEFFFGQIDNLARYFHLAYMPLPGGDGAIKQPKKIAAAYLWKSGIEWHQKIPSIMALDDEEQDILLTQLEKRINCPFTSSFGRLFDAVASLIGVRQSINYDAQAAIELENVIDPHVTAAYCFDISEGIIQPKLVIETVVNDLLNHRSISEISTKFHNGIRHLILDACSTIADDTGCRDVALSGGVMQNRFLIQNVINDLRVANFSPIFHKFVPTNDGGISLGQAILANIITKKN